jgi:hypothetical protein
MSNQPLQLVATWNQGICKYVDEVTSQIAVHDNTNKEQKGKPISPNINAQKYLKSEVLRKFEVTRGASIVATSNNKKNYRAFTGYTEIRQKQSEFPIIILHLKFSYHDKVISSTRVYLIYMDQQGEK